MSDNDSLTLNVGAKTDEASFAAAAKAAASVGGAFAKTFEQVERSSALDTAAKNFAQIAIKENDAAKAALELNDNLEAMGASSAEIDKTVKAFNRQIDAIQKADVAAAKKAANDAERAIEEESRIKELAAAEDRRANSVEGRAKNASDASGGLGDIGDNLAALGGVTGIGALGDLGGLFEAVEAFTRLKAGIQGLPESIQATSQALGLVKAAQDAATAANAASVGAQTAQTAADAAGAAASATAATAETAQAVASGGVAVGAAGAAVGLSAMLIPLLPFVAIAVAVGAALAGLAAIFGSLQAQSAAASAALEKQYAAQDEIDAFVRSGATLADAYEKQADLQNEAADATNRFNEATKALDDDFSARAAKYGDLAARLGDLFNVGSTDDVMRKRTEETKKAAEETAPKLEELTKQINEGKFAAAEATKATESNTAATTKSAAQNVSTTVSAYRAEETALAQHLSNETGLKGQAYNQQIQMVAQAANGYRALNMSGASNSFKAGSFGGLRPIPTSSPSTVNRSIGTLQINTSADPQDVIRVLENVDLLPRG